MLPKQTHETLLGKDDPFKDIIGQNVTKKLVKSALLAQRHIIVVGPPGVGKTTLAKNVAKMLGNDAPFVRVQGSPDLTVEDLLGDIDPIKAMKHGPLSPEAFTKGKIFKADKGVLFFDELNRCPEKLQNSLLQVLEEGASTIGSYDVDFDINFLFIGTMNPEDSSTEKLSDVLLDRFDMVYMDYPDTLENEKRIVTEKGVSLATVPDNLLTLIIHFIRLLRQSDKLEKKPSVRASLGIYERAQANALLEGRQEISFADIHAVLASVLSHRIRLKPSSKYLVSPEEFVEDEFQRHMEDSPLNQDEVATEKGGGL